LDDHFTRADQGNFRDFEQKRGDSMKTYFFHIPSWIHVASSCVAISKKDAIKRFKQKHGFIKMPNGYKVWESTK
jgi:hypothetical protein